MPTPAESPTEEEIQFATAAPSPTPTGPGVWACLSGLSEEKMEDIEDEDGDKFFEEANEEEEEANLKSADLRTDTGLRNWNPSALTLRTLTGLRTHMLAHTEGSNSSCFTRSVEQSFPPHSFPPVTVTLAIAVNVRPKSFITIFLFLHYPLDSVGTESLRL
jgi:hypothetical protein